MEKTGDLQQARDGKDTSIKVFIRVRPIISTESGTDEVVSVQEDNKTLSISNSLNTIQTTFDLAFRQQTKQCEIFSAFESYIPRIVEGYNLTIFAYGQTGSGKTYTMFGNDWENMISGATRNGGQQNTFFEQLETDENYAGITPRAIYTLFKSMGEEESKFKIFCSFLQIYNQKIYDLLQDVPKPRSLNIHESKLDGIFVEGLSEYSVNHYNDCLQLMKRGEKNRIIRHTSMNTKSSRSHTIFQILLQSAHADSKGIFKKARLNLCDLAGSEKVNKFEQMGNDHFKELKNINQSLTTLGKVIYSLSSGGKNVASFRESKLTRLLQESLTSNTFTFIIGNVSPSATNIDETLSTLKFVERARHIVMKVKPVEFNGMNSDMVLKLQKQVMYLKELLNMKRKGMSAADIHIKLMALQQQNQRLKKTHVSITEVQKLMEENRKMKMEIQKIQLTMYNSNSQNEDNSETKSSVSINSAPRAGQEKLSDGFSMQITNSQTELFQKKQPEKIRNSLVNAGMSVLDSSGYGLGTSQNIPHKMPSTRDETPSTPVARRQVTSQQKKEKQRILDRLDELERIQKFNEEKLVRELDEISKKHTMTTPKKSPQESIVQTQKKIGSYEDKIKKLQAKLFNK